MMEKLGTVATQHSEVQPMTTDASMRHMRRGVSIVADIKFTEARSSRARGVLTNSGHW